MDKEKQIEEMAAIMADCYNTCDECFEQLEAMLTLPIENRADHCQAYLYAQRAFDAGYRKIQEDAVVLIKDEWEKALYNARKETAREIYDFAKDFFIWDEEGFVRELKELEEDYLVEEEE